MNRAKCIPLCTKLIKMQDNSYISILIKYFKSENKSCDYGQFLDFLKLVATSNELINNVNDFSKELFDRIPAEELNCKEIVKMYGMVQNLCKSCGICPSVYLNKNSVHEEALLSCLLNKPDIYYNDFIKYGGASDIFKSVKTIIDSNGKARAFSVVKDIYTVTFNDPDLDKILEPITDLPDFSCLDYYNSDTTRSIFTGLFFSLKETKVSDSLFADSIKSVLGVDISNNISETQDSTAPSPRKRYNKNHNPDQPELKPIQNNSDNITSEAKDKSLSFIFEIFPTILDKQIATNTAKSNSPIPNMEDPDIIPNKNDIIITNNVLPESSGTILIKLPVPGSEPTIKTANTILPSSNTADSISCFTIDNCSIKVLYVDNTDEYNDIRSDILTCGSVSLAINEDNYLALFYYTSSCKNSASVAICNCNNYSIRQEIQKLIQSNGTCKIVNNIVQLYPLLNECTFLKNTLDIKLLDNIIDEKFIFIESICDRLVFEHIPFSLDNFSIIIPHLKNILDSSRNYRAAHLKKKNLLSEFISLKEYKKYIPLQEIFPIYNEHLTFAFNFARFHKNFRINTDYTKTVKLSICNNDVQLSSQYRKSQRSKYIDQTNIISFVIEQSLLTIIKSKLCTSFSFIIDYISNTSISLRCTNDSIPYVIDVLNQTTITTFRHVIDSDIKPILSLELL